ncbi:hypothetical protein [Streptomyces sp. NPDC047869]|uniref:hypothetical protein n=1 Tax=Streptomyces sp. NPDC047869 TaxID=3154709 RepID=UPI0034534CD0
MIGQTEAEVLAEEFGRSMVQQWGEWRCELRTWTPPNLSGCFAFTWRPTVLDSLGRPMRVGGNMPILVDENSGECRFVRGMREYRELSGK